MSAPGGHVWHATIATDTSSLDRKVEVKSDTLKGDDRREVAFDDYAGEDFL